MAKTNLTFPCVGEKNNSRGRQKEKKFILIVAIHLASGSLGWSLFTLVEYLYKAMVMVVYGLYSDMYPVGEPIMKNMAVVCRLGQSILASEQWTL